MDDLERYLVPAHSRVPAAWKALPTVARLVWKTLLLRGPEWLQLRESKVLRSWVLLAFST
jgi:hypothetical protein